MTTSVLQITPSDASKSTVTSLRLTPTNCQYFCSWIDTLNGITIEHVERRPSFFFFWSAQRHLYPLSVRQQRAIGGLLGCLWGFRWCGGVGRSAQKCHVYDCLCRFMPEMQPLHLGVLPADETPLVVSFFPRRFQLLVAKEVEGVSLSRKPRYDGFTAEWFRAVTLKVLFVNLQISFTLNIQPQMQRHIL